MNLQTDFEQLPTAYAPTATGVIRQSAADFKVTEHLGFSPRGEGAHLWLYVEKQHRNSIDVAEQIASAVGCKVADVGYSGLKDKAAVTRQWFSAPLEQNEFDMTALNGDGIQVLNSRRHTSKLKRGSHQANEFCIIVRDLVGDVDEIELNIVRISQNGVPNYFGAQRFGKHGNNLLQAQKLFVQQAKLGRVQRSMALSAARSYLFNQVLSARVAAGDWQKAMGGEVMMLAGSNSFFVPNGSETDLAERLVQGDIHPSGPLWGKGRHVAKGACLALEQSVVEANAAFADGLCAHGLKQGRRSLRLLVQSLQYHWLDDCSLQLKFTLPKGTFATAMLREVVKIQA